MKKENMILVAEAMAKSLASAVTDARHEVAASTIKEMLGEAARIKDRMDEDKERLDHLRQAVGILMDALGEEKVEGNKLLAYMSPEHEERSVPVAKFIALMSTITVSKKARAELMGLVVVRVAPRSLVFRRK